MLALESYSYFQRDWQFEPLIAGSGQEIDYTIDKIVASVRKLWRSNALRASFEASRLIFFD
jgi:hypothetical protein